MCEVNGYKSTVIGYSEDRRARKMFTSVVFELLFSAVQCRFDDWEASRFCEQNIINVKTNWLFAVWWPSGYGVVFRLQIKNLKLRNGKPREFESRPYHYFSKFSNHSFVSVDN